MAAYRPKKRLGQHFLRSEAIVQKIIDLVKPAKDDIIVEVGPGRGALTPALAESGARVVAVEFDRDLIGYLVGRLKQYENVEILDGDFLSFEPEFTGFKLVGNLPFNITSPVIDWCVRHVHAVRSAHLMVQKEVGERLASAPPGKGWSPVAIFTQLHFRIRACFDIAPRHFDPPPKVTSTVIELAPKKVARVEYYRQFENLVRASFRKRRKILINNLVPDVIPDTDSALEVLGELSLPDKCRAEQVTTKQFLQLTKLLVSRNML